MTALDAMVKAQNDLARQSWDIVRCQNAVKDADAALAKCRTDLSDAHVRHTKLQREYESAHETWRLSVIEDHRIEPVPTSDAPVKS